MEVHSGETGELDSDLLHLRLQNQKPISVDDLANLLAAIAKDYKRFSRGDELYVYHVEQGSLDLFMKSIAAGVAILNFLKSLLELKDKIAHSGKSPKQKKNRKSLSATAALVLEMDGDIEFNHVARDGTRTTVLRVSPQEATQIREASTPIATTPIKEQRPILTSAFEISPPEPTRMVFSAAPSRNLLASEGFHSLLDFSGMSGERHEGQLFVWTKHPSANQPGQGIIAKIDPSPKWVVFDSDDVRRDLTEDNPGRFNYVVDFDTLISPEGIVGYRITRVRDRLPHRPDPR